MTTHSIIVEDDLGNLGNGQYLTYSIQVDTTEYNIPIEKGYYFVPKFFHFINLVDDLVNISISDLTDDGQKDGLIECTLLPHNRICAPCHPYDRFYNALVFSFSHVEIVSISLQININGILYSLDGTLNSWLL